ncbi:hypothetical protein PNEG_04258 [Pneumocystis murina B123]|uniref:Uncharacterized protein n=1 Tax=Pneumocystis murina (strain B123) TaxID=1069680 RepID=A0A0W4ZX43_PNEMU|nr:hypothetical protein PNEG_04258 [Pneumocystis murina B123]KTW32936.1 hypothetical protein PNEG_04258 [Pneumocystis murina B123]
MISIYKDNFKIKPIFEIKYYLNLICSYIFIYLLSLFKHIQFTININNFSFFKFLDKFNFVIGFLKLCYNN